MNFAALLAFAFAVDIDCMVSALAYGMQRIKLPLRSKIVVALISGIMVMIAMSLGKWLFKQVPVNFIDILASLVLASIGIYRIIAVIRENRTGKERAGMIASFRIPFLCIAIQILREPAKADMDADGTVDSRDAVMLGIALALDATAGGFAIALAGMPILATSATTAALSFVLLIAAYSFGWHCRGALLRHSLSQKLLTATEYLPGIILIILAIWRII